MVDQRANGYAKFLLSVILYIAGLFLVFAIPKIAVHLNDTVLPPSSAALKAVITAVLTFIFAGYWIMIVNLKGSGINLVDPGKSQLYFWTALASALTLLLWSQAVLSGDIYEYSIRGRMLTIYGMNPYVHAPCDVTGDMFYNFVFLKRVPECQGPLWALLGAVHTVFFTGTVILTGFMHKTWLFLFYCGSGYLFLLIARTLKFRDHDFRLLVYLTNPLLVFMTLVEGHNEIVILFFTLAALYSVLKDRYFWTIVFFALAACINLIYFIVVPFLLIYMLFRGRKGNIFSRSAEIFCGVLAALFITAMLWVPFGAEGVRAAIRNFGPAGSFSARALLSYVFLLIPLLLLSRVKYRFLLSLFLSYFIIMAFWDNMYIYALGPVLVCAVVLAARRRWFFSEKILLIEEER